MNNLVNIGDKIVINFASDSVRTARVLGFVPEFKYAICRFPSMVWTQKKKRARWIEKRKIVRGYFKQRGETWDLMGPVRKKS